MKSFNYFYIPSQILTLKNKYKHLKIMWFSENTLFQCKELPTKHK